MSRIKLGTGEAGAVYLDLPILSDTRLLVQASSGSGKSWLLRLIAERAAEKIQTIILDPEGEFATLREKLDVLLVGQDYDVAADVRSAGLLARKILESGVSAVIDLYDIPLHEDNDVWDSRRAYVAEFLGSLMNVPKSLYKPVLVIVDEAHQFSPEAAGASKRGDPVSLSRRTINTLASAGRKRGYACLLATQRISKLHKDAIAECKNVFIGGTNLDIDQDRAGDILGVPRSERVGLRDLRAGEFHAFGPALSFRGVSKLQTDVVITSHPKAGQRGLISVPKASGKIKDIVGQIGDLPAQIKVEEDKIAALEAEVGRLRRERDGRVVIKTGAGLLRWRLSSSAPAIW